ncbi:hypothetical protein ACFQ08_43090 [Streptosporangium algeriense]|uniref:Uncharacterized protein n=1 Tax=Streptosporangium algeriense TaxID=1682748 RepID=A0ABW3E620_9ACTN
MAIEYPPDEQVARYGQFAGNITAGTGVVFRLGASALERARDVSALQAGAVDLWRVPPVELAELARAERTEGRARLVGLPRLRKAISTDGPPG